MTVANHAFLRPHDRGDEQNPNNIRALTGIRGIAAFTVAAYHLAYLFAPMPYRGYVFPGYLAVDLFFCLSGFVLALTYSKRFRTDRSIGGYVGFLQKRFCRIYPVYFVLLALKVPTTVALGTGKYQATTVVINLLLVQYWGIGALNPEAGLTIFGASWSISTEWLVYFIFPVLLSLVMFRRWQTAAAIGILCFLGLFLVSVLAPGARGPLDSNDGATLYPMVRCVAGFTLGLIAWRVASNTRFLQPHGAWLDVVLIGSLACLLAMPGSDVLIAGLFPLVIVRICVPRSPIGRILSGRVPYFLGEISYSLYLIQSTTVALMQDRLASMLAAGRFSHPRLEASVILLAVDVGIATTLFTIVEKPARDYLRRLLERRTPPSIALDPAAP